MNPDLETYLDEVFASVQPTSPDIGRVVLQPNYEDGPPSGNAEQLRAELVQLLQAQHPGLTGLESHDGVEIVVPDQFPTLHKFIRTVTLYANRLEGSWIEIVPAGSWI